VPGSTKGAPTGGVTDVVVGTVDVLGLVVDVVAGAVVRGGVVVATVGDAVTGDVAACGVVVACGVALTGVQPVVACHVHAESANAASNKIGASSNAFTKNLSSQCVVDAFI
jgi:hypothetical protein